MSGAYAGESIAKKVCRVRLYRRVRAAWRFAGVEPANAGAIFLPGPDAAEIGALRIMLGIRADRLLAIDRDQASCDEARRRCAGLEFICGDLMDFEVFAAAHSFGACGFVHLDLMGNLTEASTTLYQRWQVLVGRGGVLAATFLRGREMPGSLGRSFNDLCAVRQSSGPVDRRYERLLGPDKARAAAHLSFINAGALENQARLGNAGSAGSKMVHETSFALLSSHSYRAETSPMGVIAAQRVDKSTYGSESYERFRFQRNRDCSSAIKKDPMDDLLAEADSLEKEFSKQQVAEILNVTPGTLAAWRAHRTMGSYV